MYYMIGPGLVIRDSFKFDLKGAGSLLVHKIKAAARGRIFSKFFFHNYGTTFIISVFDSDTALVFQFVNQAIC